MSEKTITTYKGEPVEDPDRARFLWASDGYLHTRKLSPFVGTAEDATRTHEQGRQMDALCKEVMEGDMCVSCGWKALRAILGLSSEEMDIHTEQHILDARMLKM